MLWLNGMMMMLLIMTTVTFSLQPIFTRHSRCYRCYTVQHNVVAASSWAAWLLRFNAYGKAASSAAVAVEAQVEATGR
jgi:hypothetical protein